MSEPNISKLSLKELLMELEIDIFKLQEISKDSNLVLYLKKHKKQLINYNLISLYDFISSNYPISFLKIYYKWNENFELKLKLNEISEYQARKEIVLNTSKEKKAYFMKFKNDVLPLILNVVNLNFAPITDSIIKIDSLKYLNTYKPKNDFKNIKSNNKAQFPHLKAIMKNIFNSVEAYDKWILFLAWKIQNPLIQLPINWIILDEGGTGKTELLIGDIVDRLFNAIVISQDDLNGTFNFYQENNQFVICEEIENFSNYKKIKVQTGAKTISINIKGLAQYTVKNYNTYVILSNDIKPMKIDRNDRRFNIVGGGKRLVPLYNQNWTDDKVYFNSELENEQFFKKYHENLKNEIKELYSYLISLKLNRNEIQKTINNSQKTNLIKINITSEQDFVAQILELGLESFIEDNFLDGANWTNTKIFRIFEVKINKGYWVKSSDIYLLYKKFCENARYSPIGHTSFTSKIFTLPDIEKLFCEHKLITYSKKTFRSFKLNGWKNESVEANEILPPIIEVEPTKTLPLVEITSNIEPNLPLINKLQVESSLSDEFTEERVEIFDLTETEPLKESSSNSVKEQKKPEFIDDVFAGISVEGNFKPKKSSVNKTQELLNEVLDELDDDYL